jgi:hypothetical protein
MAQFWAFKFSIILQKQQAYFPWGIVHQNHTGTVVIHALERVELRTEWAGLQHKRIDSRNRIAESPVLMRRPAQFNSWTVVVRTAVQNHALRV